MKTLENDFKGTQGEFFVEKRKTVMPSYIGGKVHGAGLLELNVAAIWFSEIHKVKTFEEAEANARLFANSKKVLEAAIEAHGFVCVALGYEAARASSNPDDISVFVQDHPFRKKLEQAINDSL